jgi:DNA polymerase-3 subunit delta
MLGNDTRQARHEIAKALAFAAYARPVSAQDVRQVCNVSVQEKVFALTDACAEGQRARALSLLREQLRENSEGALLGMLARQFRNLIIARESLSQRGSEQDISAACGVPLFAARKLVQQARRFELERLVSLVQRLDELDGAIKSGQSAADTGLELFIAQLSA